MLLFLFSISVLEEVSASSSVQIYGKLDTRLVDGKKIIFKDGIYDIASSVIKSGRYGYDDFIYLKDVTRGDKIKIYIGSTYVGVVKVNSKVLEHDLRVTHLIPDILGPEVGDMVIEKSSKKTGNFLYFVMGFIIFMIIVGAGVFLGIKTDFLPKPNNFLKKNSSVSSVGRSNGNSSINSLNQTESQNANDTKYQQLVNYIAYYRNQGYSDEQIKSGLINAGWDESILNQYL